MTLDNPFLKRGCKEGKQAHGKKYEKRLSKSIGGKLVPNSGALAGAKGDITFEDFRMECKTTSILTIPLKYDWMCKIAHEARETNTKAAIAFSFVTGDGKSLRDGDWIAVPRRVFDELLDGRCKCP